MSVIYIDTKSTKLRPKKIYNFMATSPRPFESKTRNRHRANNHQFCELAAESLLALFTTHHFLHNLRMCPVSWSVSPANLSALE